MSILFNDTDYNLNLSEEDFQELKKRAYSQFGWPTVAVELKDDNFKYIIKRGVMYLNTYAPKIDYISKTVYPYVTDYEILEYEKVTGFLDLYVSVEYLIGLGLPIQSLLGVPMSLAASRNSSHLINFVSLFANYDIAKRIFQTKPKVEHVRPNIGRINPAPYKEAIFKFVIAVDHDTDLSSLNDYEINWLERFCQANVGKVLGQIRRKYSGVTLPVGALDLSGQGLYAEAVQKEEELLKEIKLRHKFPQSFITIG